MSRSSSLNLVGTLTKTLGFKNSTTCPRKSTTAAPRVDITAPYRATCSSALKIFKFPEHHMLNPGGIKSEGASIMKVCPYTYCSLNGNQDTPLPQSNRIMSAKRGLLKTRKNIKMEAPERLKVSCETRKEVDIEPIVSDGKPACDEPHKGDLIINHLIHEIGMDLFIKANAKEREKAYKMGRSDAVKHLEDQEGIKFAMEGKGNIAEERCVYQVIPCLPFDVLTESETNPKVEFKNYYDTFEIEADTKESFHQEPNVEDADRNHPPSWFHEETCTGSYCPEVGYDEEQMVNIELDDSDSQGTDMEWGEEQLCPVNYKEIDIGSYVITQETDSKFKSLSEESHDIFETWLDDILSNHYVENIVEKAQQSIEEKITYFNAQPHDSNSLQEITRESIQTNYSSNGIDHEYNQSYLEKEEFQYLTSIEDNCIEIEKHVDNEVGCASMVLDEGTVDHSEGQKICETPKIEESLQDNNKNLENNDNEIGQRNRISSSDVPEESAITVQDQELLEGDQVTTNKFQAKSCVGGEEQNTNNSWQWPAKNKRRVQDVEENRKINPRKPKFLPLVSDQEPEKVELKHQMVDDRKNAEEWMLDFSLRQAVTKLAPSRKKVSLLVEAFETVMSTSKCETRRKNNSPLAHLRPVQACG